MPDLEHVLKQAFAPAVDLILHLESRVDRSCRWVLAAIRANLTEPEYSIAKLRRDLGVSNNWLMSTFRKLVGLTPWRFIKELRLWAAARMLRDTALGVGQIVILVGYVDLSSFVRLFKDWCGAYPTDFREHLGAARRRAGAMPKAVLTLFYWRRLPSELTRAEVRELAVYLLRLVGPLTEEGILTTGISCSDRLARHLRFREPYVTRQSKPARPESSDPGAAPEPDNVRHTERR
jgi:AraC-like DNA-binding protein